MRFLHALSLLLVVALLGAPRVCVGQEPPATAPEAGGVAGGEAADGVADGTTVEPATEGTTENGTEPADMADHAGHDHGENGAEHDHDHSDGGELRAENATEVSANATEVAVNVTSPASNQTDALSCFVCNSAYEALCGEPFNPDAAEAAGFLVECPAVPGVGAVCRKVRQVVPGDIRIVRSCGHDNNAKGCYFTTEADTASHACHCFEDGCNSAPAGGAAVLLVALAAALGGFW